MSALLILGASQAIPSSAFSKQLATNASPHSRLLPIYRARFLPNDLEVSGMIEGLPEEATGYVRFSDLLMLPKVTTTVAGDENFSELAPGLSVLVTGIDLQVLSKALGVAQESDFIEANCTDGYQGHYPSTYLAVHHPILALSINNLSPAEWAAKSHQMNYGPYFITHPHFVPSFRILAHDDEPQVPTNVVHLTFRTTADAYRDIQPRGNVPAESPIRMGFIIASQNCLRCHNQGNSGGSKAGRNWSILSTWASEEPAYFSNYVKDPKALELRAKMPGNPQYDAATLAALTAYFRTFTSYPAGTDQ